MNISCNKKKKEKNEKNLLTSEDGELMHVNRVDSLRANPWSNLGTDTISPREESVHL